MQFLRAAWIYCGLCFGFWTLFARMKIKKLEKFGCILMSPDKEHSWMDINLHNINFLKVNIGPHMPWPAIQQIIRFIVQYQKKVILTVDGDPWKTKGQSIFADQYKDWLITLLNRYQIPSCVLGIQLLEQRDCSFFKWYDNFYTTVTSIDLNDLREENRNVKFLSCELPSVNTKCGGIVHANLGEESYYKNSEYICEELILPSYAYQIDKNTVLRKSNLFDKIKWINTVFWTIYDLLKVKKRIKGRKIFVTNFKVQSLSLCIKDITVCYYILQRIFGDGFIGLLYNNQMAMRNRGNEVWVDLKKFK